MIKNLPTLYRQDPWVNELYKVSQVELDRVKLISDDNYSNIFFKSLTDYGCTTYEHDLGLTSTGTIEDRRTRIEAHWRANTKCNIESLQNVCDNYFNGDVIVTYTGNAVLTYVTQLGYNYYNDAKRINEFILANDEVKPAHFDIAWGHIHNKWKDYHLPFSWSNMTVYTWATVPYGGRWQDINRDLVNVNWDYVINLTWGDVLTRKVIYGD